MARVPVAAAPSARLTSTAGRRAVALLGPLMLLGAPALGQATSDSGPARPAPSDAGLADPAVDGGGGGAPEPMRCYAINFGGGCCLQDRWTDQFPCPAGWAPEDACFSVRNFCPVDPIDAGRPPPDAGHVTTDAGTSTRPDARAASGGALPSARADCGCRTGTGGAQTPGLATLALGLLLARRRR